MNVLAALISTALLGILAGVFIGYAVFAPRPEYTGPVDEWDGDRHK